MADKNAGFDVFLAHNSKDKSQIRALGAELEQRGLKPWIDEDQIAPGRQFQDLIQKAISKVKTAAIVIGPKGLGKWHALELHAFTSQCVNKGIPLIPVLLPGLETLPDELIFLKEFSWVKFTSSVHEENALDSLEWGIRGNRPKRKTKAVPVLMPLTGKKSPLGEKSAKRSKQVITSSGDWVLLNGGFYKAERVSCNESRAWTVVIVSRNAQEEAALNRLQQNPRSIQPLDFAYENDGFLVRLKEVQSEREKSRTIWTITLNKEEFQWGIEPTYQMPHGDLKPDDVANLRAKWILLDESPPESGKRAVFCIKNIVRGNNVSIPVSCCALKPVYALHKRAPRLFLEQARLAAILALRGADVVEQILELSLGPIEVGKVHVLFRGIRRQRQLGQIAPLIQVEGDCRLSDWKY